MDLFLVKVKSIRRVMYRIYENVNEEWLILGGTVANVWKNSY